MFSLRAVKSSWSSSHVAISCQKYPCKVNQSLFEGWDQQRSPQILVLRKDTSGLDRTQTEYILNTTWKIKPKPNRNLYDNPKTEMKLKMPSVYSPILFMDNSFPKNTEACSNNNAHYRIEAAFSPRQIIAVFKGERKGGRGRRGRDR